MGFIYEGRKLCCDFCGTAGAKKMPCPVGWCQACATCPECRKAGKHRRANDSHNHCRAKIAEKQAEMRQLKAGGLHLVAEERPNGFGGGTSFWVQGPWYFTVCDLFNRTGLEPENLAQLRAMGHTVEITKTQETNS